MTSKKYDAVFATLAALTAGPAWPMVRQGPVSCLTVPADLVSAGAGTGKDQVATAQHLPLPAMHG